MEWIETTGKTVEEAKERALAELGIEETELEFEVVQEPRGGLLRRAAHVRARVRPVSREKPERRRRGRSQGGNGRGGGQGRGGNRGGQGRGGRGDQGGQREGRREGGGQRREREPRSEGEDRPGRQREPRPPREPRVREERVMSDVPMEEQAKAAEEFTRGLVDAFDLEADVRVEIDDEFLRIFVDGDGVGVLIGRDGTTMEAIREVVKTNLQRQTEGHPARVSIDVGGYGARRRAALEEFARGLAEKAIETGRAQVLEPMSPPDRKIVHDAVGDIDGVSTLSEGEEPRRRVVIEPT